MSHRSCNVLMPIMLAALVCAGSMAVPALAQCEEAKLTAPDAPAGKFFGLWVAVSGDYVAAGSPGHENAVCVFRRDENAWRPHQKLEGLVGRLAMSGEWLLVGAPPDDEVAEDAGAVFVFRLEGTTWVQVQKLTAQDGAAADEFGSSVAIDDDVIVVGANGVDEAAPDAGAVYVFRWNGVTWGQEAKLTGSPADDEDRLGWRSVSVSGNAIIAAAFHGPPHTELGKAFIFRRSEGTWRQEQYFNKPDAAFMQIFPFQVAIDGHVAVLGVPARGTNEDPGPPGSVYVFAYDGTGWIEEEKLESPESYCRDDAYGAAIALRNGLLVVGAAVGSQDTATCTGTAYLYQRVGTTWVERGKLSRSDAEKHDVFGIAIALDSERVVVGAPDDDDTCPGNPRCDSGSAYVFPIAQCRTETDPLYSWGSDCADVDGDGVAGICGDDCLSSDLGDTIVIARCETGVDNQLFPDGCTMADRITECVAGGAENHGLIVKCITRVAGDWHRDGLISGVDLARIVRCARFVHRTPGRSRIPTQQD